MIAFSLEMIWINIPNITQYRQLMSVLCRKTDEWVHGEIRDAQLIAGVWSIVVNSQQALTHLVEKVRYININNNKD